MKDKWLKDIHDQMENYEVNEPSGLWEKVQTSIQEGKHPQQHRAARTILLWTKYVGGIAAMIALVFFLINLENNHQPDKTILGKATQTVRETNAPTEKTSQPLQQEIVITGEANVPTKSTMTAEYKENNSVRKQTQPNAHKEKLIAGKTVRSNDRYIDSVAVPTPNEVKQVQIDKYLATAEKEKKKENKEQKKKQTLYPAENVYFAQNTAIKTHRHSSGSLEVGAFTSGGTGYAQNSKSTPNTLIASTGPEDSNWKDSPLLGMLLYNNGKEVKTEVKHHQPIRIGLSVAYNINKHIGIESGITYTKLSSDIKEGSNINYYSDRQELYYLGIPLNLKYNAFTWNNFELYASAGFLVEKCVSGKLKREYTLDKQSTTETTDDITPKQLQWSANASLGVQYRLSPLIGIYVEPGASYYFKDGSSVNTIYKEKPLNYNINLGLRFTLGDK